MPDESSRQLHPRPRNVTYRINSCEEAGAVTITPCTVPLYRTAFACTESLLVLVWRQRRISGSCRVATLALQTLNANCRDATRSTGSPPRPTARSSATTPSGETVRRRPWTASASPTPNGAGRSTGATAHGSSSTTWQQSCCSPELPPPSSPLGGYSAPGFTCSPP